MRLIKQTRPLAVLFVAFSFTGCDFLDGKAEPYLIQTIHSPSVLLEYRVRLNEWTTVKRSDARGSAEAVAKRKCEQLTAGLPRLISERSASSGSLGSPTYRNYYYLRFECVDRAGETDRADD